MFYVPSLFNADSLMDDWMDDFDNGFSRMNNYLANSGNALYGHRVKDLMKTDVREKDGNYIVDIDLPGFTKDDVNVKLENGYLTVSTSKSLDKESKDKKGNVIRKERYSGNLGRSFYVGDDINKNDIHAKYENGVLTLTLPKKDAKRIEEDKNIAIEG